jgi:hypothetical protein
MSMAKSILSFLVTLVLAAGSAVGSEVWAFRFNAFSPAISTSWRDDLVFHNTNTQDAVVRLIGISNGGVQVGDLAEVTVPADRTVSLTNLFGVWQPQDATLWVVHVDVPDGVLAFSRGGAYGECPSPCTVPRNPLPGLGAFSMPLFRALVSAGQPQIHMGADLGFQPSRINVGIYNAGASAAKATVVVFQACDDAALESRTISISPDTVVQLGGLGSAKAHCESQPEATNIWLRYVTVTMDQPGLSYIVSLADPLPAYPRILLSVPIGN